ncbi:MAG: hypothetical protein ACRDHW_20790 [Ktedonobacteraceae bacterium]
MQADEAPREYVLLPLDNEECSTAVACVKEQAQAEYFPVSRLLLFPENSNNRIRSPESSAFLDDEEQA